MAQANIGDRDSLARIYPEDAFSRDAAQNALGSASVLHGLRIMSQPDETGAFEIVAAKRQSGERDPEGDSAFLPPFIQSDPTGGTGGAPASGQRGRDYADYLDRVIAVARRIEFKTASGQDPRLKGFRGG